MKLEILRKFYLLSFLALLPTLNSQASTRCAKDGLGTVYCSRSPGGSAMRDSLGMVVCGKGECAKDGLGMIECSKESGGGAMRGSFGIVECSGGCESASEMNCAEAR